MFTGRNRRDRRELRHSRTPRSRPSLAYEILERRVVPALIAPIVTPITSPIAVVVGDFNGDGKPDVASFNAGTAKIDVMLGLGDGTFGAPTSAFAGVQRPSGLIEGDFNGDGRIDLGVLGGDIVTFGARGPCPARQRRRDVPGTQRLPRARHHPAWKRLRPTRRRRPERRRQGRPDRGQPDTGHGGGVRRQRRRDVPGRRAVQRRGRGALRRRGRLQRRRPRRPGRRRDEPHDAARQRRRHVRRRRDRRGAHLPRPDRRRRPERRPRPRHRRTVPDLPGKR